MYFLARALTRVLTGYREVCVDGRALHPLPCEAGNTVRGLCSVVNRIREDFTSLYSIIR